MPQEYKIPIGMPFILEGPIGRAKSQRSNVVVAYPCQAPDLVTIIKMTKGENDLVYFNAKPEDLTHKGGIVYSIQEPPKSFGSGKKVLSPEQYNQITKQLSTPIKNLYNQIDFKKHRL